MMTRTIEWLNANRYRRYPFRDDSVMTYTGSRTLDNSVLLDAHVVSSSRARYPLELLDFEVSVTQVIFCFGYDNLMFYAVVPQAASFPYTVTGTSLGLRYTLTFGEGAGSLLDLPAGTYTMTTPPVVQPALVTVQNKHRVDTIRAVGTDQATLYGLVYVEPGYNCEPTVKPDFIQLNAGLGIGAGRYCIPLTDEVVSCANALLWWNGQSASEDGNVLLMGGTGVQVEPQPELNLIVIRGSKLLENFKCG